jgi:hypothetical protein
MANWWILSNSSGATTKFDVVEDANTPIPTTAWPNAPIGPFSTKADAEANVSGAQSSGGYGIAPIGPNSATGAGVAAGVGIIPQFTGLAAIGDFFGRLTEANTWLRIGEGLLGIVLIAIALGKLTGLDDNIKSAAASAVKYVK